MTGVGVFLVRCGLLPGAATPTARPVLRVCDVAVCGACEVADCRLALGSWLVIASARYLLAPSPLGYRFPNDPRPNHPRWVARCSLHSLVVAMPRPPRCSQLVLCWCTTWDKPSAIAISSSLGSFGGSAREGRPPLPGLWGHVAAPKKICALSLCVLSQVAG